MRGAADWAAPCAGRARPGLEVALRRSARTAEGCWERFGLAREESECGAARESNAQGCQAVAGGRRTRGPVRREGQAMIILLNQAQLKQTPSCGFHSSGAPHAAARPMRGRSAGGGDLRQALCGRDTWWIGGSGGSAATDTRCSCRAAGRGGGQRESTSRLSPTDSLRRRFLRRASLT